MGCTPSRLKNQPSQLATVDFSAESWDFEVAPTTEQTAPPPLKTKNELKKDIEKRRLALVKSRISPDDYTLYEVPLRMTEMDYSKIKLMLSIRTTHMTELE